MTAMESLVVFIVVLIVWAVFGWFGAYIAEQKGRGSTEGFVLGFLFGPLGCLIEALLPTQHRPLTYRRPISDMGPIVPEMPGDWGKPGAVRPPAPDDGVDMNWLKSP